MRIPLLSKWLERRASRKYWHSVNSDDNVPSVMNISGLSILFAPPELRKVLMSIDSVRENDPLAGLLDPQQAPSN